MWAESAVGPLFRNDMFRGGGPCRSGPVAAEPAPYAGERSGAMAQLAENEFFELGDRPAMVPR